MGNRIQVYRSLSDINHLLDDELASGESSLPRNEIGASSTQTSQVLRLTFFKPRKSEAITSVRLSTTGTAAGATPTLIRIGIWEADVDNSSATFTLVASTPNDTSLLAATNTRYTKALSSTWNKRAGIRCAAGLLVVTAAAAPTVAGSVRVGSGDEYLEWPPNGGSITGQADLPNTFTMASLVAGSSSVSRPYVAFIP